MNAYQHFGLSRPPFEPDPDPDWFYDSPQHQEALATLQYTAQAHKGCCVVLGESGAGKTLLARMLCQSADPQTALLWIDGLQAGDSALSAALFAPGAFAQACPALAGEATTLEQWSQSRLSTARPALLIVDNADELPPAAWQRITALLAAEAHGRPAPDLALFGLPRLAPTLASPALLRLRRRVFRTYLVCPLNQEQVCAYVRGRLARAGAGRSEIFTPDAFEQLYRLTRGNPGLINQVCDNALIDAYGEDRRRITGRDIWTAIHTMIGGHLLVRGAADRAPWAGGGFATLPGRECDAGAADLPAAAPSGPEPGPTVTYHPLALPAVLARASRRVVTTTVDATCLEPTGDIRRRLRNLERRLGRALEAVREARRFHEGPPPRAEARPRCAGHWAQGPEPAGASGASAAPA